MIISNIKRMNNLIELYKNKDITLLKYLIPQVWGDTYNKFTMIEDKKSIYKYMHDYTVSLDMDKTLVDENFYNNYILIKFIDDYEKYNFILNTFNKINYNIKELNDKIYTLEKHISNYETYNQKINNKIDSLINNLAWWIPIKKWRDNFRNKFNI